MRADRIHAVAELPVASNGIEPRKIQPRAWSREDDAYLAARNGIDANEDIAVALCRTTAAVRNRRYALKLPKVENSWSTDEIVALRLAYSSVRVNPEIGLDELSASLGRLKSNVCRKARELGLTDISRKTVLERKSRRKFATVEEYRKDVSERTKRYIAERGHPKGYKGRSHSVETRAVIGRKSRSAAERRTPEQQAAITDKAMKSRLASQGSLAPNHKRGSWKAGWREIGGVPKFYRSRWEANYARYLNWLQSRGDILDWKHEPETFWFEAIRRGVRSYLPDFRVWELDGSSRLHEVKGWMDDRSRTTLRRMAKYHPGETIVLIKEREYREIERRLGPLIEGWE